MNNLAWMLFIAVILFVFQQWYYTEEMKKGEAIQEFLFIHHNMSVSVEQARHMSIYITTYDVSLGDISIYEAPIFKELPNERHRGSIERP